MRIPTFTLALLCAFLTSFAQTDQQRLRPAEMIYETKVQGTSFERVELFQLLAAQKSADSEIEQRIEEYDLLQLQTQSARRLLKSAPKTLTFSLPSISRSEIELELVKVDIYRDGLTVIESGTNTPAEVETGVHYRGVIKDEPGSVAAISIFEGEVMGVVSSEETGNLVIGKLQEEDAGAQHVVYNDRDVLQQEEFFCGTPDEGPDYTIEDISPGTATRDAGDCVGLYFEVDYDIYENKGGTNGAVSYVEGIFNQVATLYANENVNIRISEIFVWTNPSPYNGNNSSQLLNQFQQYRNNFNGDLAQLLSYKASGGIAVLNGLCHPYNSAKMSFSSINTSYRTVPTYSFTVMVVAHEFGHLLGSHHTHACVWNGNNTAIDGCAGFTEGSCRNPGTPSGGGTIMSYCHISNVGINFNQGFGNQPGNVIRNRIAAASCLQACGSGDGGGGSGGGNDGGGSGGGDNGGGGSDCVEVSLRIVLDNYGTETFWKLLDEAGDEIAAGGPYDKGVAGTQVRETFCLTEGCYRFEITDAYGDGICCGYGNGIYTLTWPDGSSIVTGGNFAFSEITNFCVTGDDDGGGNGGGNSNCLQLDFKNYRVQSYGGGQDIGTHQLINNGQELKIQNNAWKALEFDYTVTPNTVLDFEFGSTLRGEVHGIGFDNDNSISANRTFKLFGTQSWGIRTYDNYPGDQTWRRYVIPVGEFYTGNFDRLFFVADNDSGRRDGNSYFRNIKIYEGESCQAIVAGEVENERQLAARSRTMAAREVNFEVFPNPARNQITLNFRCKEDGDATMQIFNMVGQAVKTMPIGVYEGMNTERLDIADLPNGTYLIRIDTRVNQLVSKFNVSR